MSLIDIQDAELKVTFWNKIQIIGGGLVVLGVLLELVGHLIAAPIENRLSEYRKSEIARLNSEAASSRAKAAELEYRIEEEKKKREPRYITPDMEKILSTLKNKISIAFAFENNPESERFAQQILSAIFGNGASASWIRLNSNSIFGPTQGLFVYIPSKPSSTAEAEKDIVYSTFMKAGLHIGTTNAPDLIANQNPEIHSIPKNNYILFVGLKPLY